MSFYSLIILVFLIILSAVSVNSMCVEGQVNARITKYGTPEIVCTYNNIKVLPGSSFKLSHPDCMDCKCTAKSMSCCGFGFAAGVAGPPPGCIAHNDACKLIFVKQNNQSEICKPPKGAASKKKKPVVPARRKSNP